MKLSLLSRVVPPMALMKDLPLRSARMRSCSSSTHSTAGVDAMAGMGHIMMMLMKLMMMTQHTSTGPIYVIALVGCATWFHATCSN
jgi:hypothetical protein